MAKRFNKSLTLRLGLAMATITGLAFLGMLSSVFIADISEGQAAAINQSGTLRMQSYRIASELAGHRASISPAQVASTRQLLADFETRFNDPRLTGVLAKSKDAGIHATYNHIKTQWQDVIQPLLEQYLGDLQQIPADAGRLQDLRDNYLQRVDGFVSGIDRLVHTLETEAETNIQWLRLIQLISLFLTLAVVIATMYFVYNNVLPPLQELLNSAKAARRGDFSHRTLHVSEDELGELGHAFNRMAEDLSKIYANLESRVREKTSDLERSNRSLELLYKATSRLIESPLSNDAYQLLLLDIQELIGVGPGTICLGKQHNIKAFRLASTFSVANEGIYKLCQKADCQDCFASADSHVVHIEHRRHATHGLFSTPIKDAEQQYGVLVVGIPAHGLETWQERLLEAVASHIAMALKMAQRSSQARQIALLEERGVIARELHDSLAQSLSYLKIQVTRLNVALASVGHDQKVDEISKELREGLNNAYRELRELLTTFRLRIDEEGLSRALEKTVAEFNDRSHIDIELDNQLGNCPLSPNAEIHIIQIVREALSNVVRHSRASHAAVSASYQPPNQISLRITDDGIGMPDNNQQRHHYGLAIMRERAQSLNGALSVETSAQGGTCVSLRFKLDKPETAHQPASA